MTKLSLGANISLNALYSAWRQARRKKKPSFNQLAFEMNWLAHLLTLKKQLDRHWRLTQRLLKRFSWLEQCFVFQPNARPKPRFACGTQHFMQDQIAYFRQMYPDALLQIQKGYRWLPYGPKGGVARRIVTIQECGYLKHGLKRREAAAIHILINPLISKNKPAHIQRSPYENLNQNPSLSA